MTLFFDRAGPLMMYGDGTLSIEDLNPEMKTRWRMRRGEMLLLGLRCIWAAIRA
jgi:hypothetical protein